jgi:hypothetical protein
MKKVTLWYLLALLTVVGCQKNTLTNETAQLPQNEHNRTLVQSLINGNLGKTGNGAAQRTACSYTVAVQNGMLAFNSACGVTSFLEALDSVKAGWDGTNDPELLGSYAEKSLAGDPAMNAVENALGFTSLRRSCERGFYDDNAYESKLPVQVTMPDLKAILNTQYELAVGDTIYKFVKTGIVAKIANNNLAALNKLRQAPVGVGVYDADIRYYNVETGDDITGVYNVVSPSGCTMLMGGTNTQNVNGDYREVKLDYIAGAQDNGQPQVCLIEYTVDWGDGYTNTNLTGTFSHTYNYNSTGPTDCKQYTYTITARSISVCGINGSCTNASISRPGTFSICLPIKGCVIDDEAHSDKFDFVLGNYNYRLEGTIGAQTNLTGLSFLRPMVWGKSALYLKAGSFLFPVRYKSIQLGVVIRGNWVTNACTTIKRVDGNSWRYFVKEVESHNLTGDNKFGWTPEPGLQTIADHYIYQKQGGNAVQIGSIIGHYIHY